MNRARYTRSSPCNTNHSLSQHPKHLPYLAELWLMARVILNPNHSGAQLSFFVDGIAETLEVGLHPSLQASLIADPNLLLKDQPLACKLWVRTGGRGRLRQGICMLHRISATALPQNVPRLTIQGRVKGVAMQEGYLRIAILPTRRSHLEKGFEITLLATKDLLACVQVGQAVRIQGTLGVERRLVATDLEFIQLLPARRVVDSSEGGVFR